MQSANGIVHLKAMGQEAVETSGALEFRKKASGALWAAGFCLLGFLFFRALAYVELHFGPIDAGRARLSKGVSIFCLIMCGISLIGALWALLNPEGRVYARVDFSLRTLTRRKKITPFDQISHFVVASFGQSTSRLSALTTSGDSVGLWMDSNKRYGAMAALAERLNAALRTIDSNTAPAVPPAVAAASGKRAYNQFAALIFIGIGLFWLIAGYFFYKDLFFVSALHPSRFPVPIWWAGPFCIALGLFKLWQARKKR